MLRQRVLTGRKSGQVHDEIFVFVDMAAKKLPTHVTQYTHFGEGLGIESDVYQVTGALLDEGRVINKLAKAQWVEINLVDDVINALSGLVNSCVHEPAPTDEIFSSLHYLLLLQKHVPNFFAAVGIAPKGDNGLMGSACCHI